MYYKPMTIINDDSRVIPKLEISLTDDDRVIIYDHHMFLVQATDFFIIDIVAQLARINVPFNILWVIFH